MQKKEKSAIGMELEYFYNNKNGVYFYKTILPYISSFSSDDKTCFIGYSSPYTTVNRSFDFIPSFLQANFTSRDNLLNRFPRIIGSYDRLPFCKESLTCVVVVHALEYVQYPLIFLKEIWRILQPEGRMLIVVPHKYGMARIFRFTSIWSECIAHSFTYDTLVSLMQDSLFTPQYLATLGYIIPLRTPKFMQSIWNVIGRIFFRGLGDVVLIECVKHVYASSSRLRHHSPVAPTYNNPGLVCCGKFSDS